MAVIESHGLVLSVAGEFLGSDVVLVDAGIDGATLETIGVGSREPLRVGAATPGFELNRSVTFRVAVNEAKAPTSQAK